HILNDPLFDAYLRELGAEAAPNRHSLQAEYLPQLDELVVSEYSSQLKKTICVSLSADGWRDRIRRNWISLGFYFMVDDDGVWRIEVIHPDLIPISISSTSEAISEL